MGAALALLGMVTLFAVTRDTGDDRAQMEPATTTTSDRSATTSSPRAPTTTSVVPPSTTGSTEPVPGPGDGLPAPVTSATAGGGSGETVVRWSAVPIATSYRVLEAGATGGPFVEVVSVDVVTGETSAAPGIVNVFSEEHSYLPASTPLAAPDGSSWFEVVDTDGGAERCYVTVAVNAAGSSAASPVACAPPP